MIKTFRLSRLIYALLMLIAVIAAFVFFFSAEEDETPYVFSFGKQNLPILIIDPGHGGADGGASSESGALESVINLEISKKMAAIAELTGLPYAMTRDSEEIKYPDSAKTIASKKIYDQKKRVEMINDTPNAVLISIHQNKFPHKSVSGPQSFFSKAQGSDLFAELVQNSVNSAICPGNRRIAAPIAQNLYLFKNINCTAVLIECGFLSNPNEEQLLSTDEYKLKIALALTSAYLQYLGDKDK